MTVASIQMKNSMKRPKPLGIRTFDPGHQGERERDGQEEPDERPEAEHVPDREQPEGGVERPPVGQPGVPRLDASDGRLEGGPGRGHQNSFSRDMILETPVPVQYRTNRGNTAYRPFPEAWASFWTVSTFTRRAEMARAT